MAHEHPGAPQAFAVGERVTWLHVPRGGYGYPFPVDAEVVRVAARRVRIRVEKQGGEPVERWVRPEHLRRPVPGMVPIDSLAARDEEEERTLDAVWEEFARRRSGDE